MSYAGYCQGCVNEKGEGRACGQNPLTYCDRHLLEMYDSIKKYGEYYNPNPFEKYTQEDVDKILKQYENEIRSRGLQVD